MHPSLATEKPAQAVPPLLFDVRQAMQAIGGISERTLFSISQPRGPLKTIRIGRRVFYRPSDIEKYLVQLAEGTPEQNLSKEDQK